MNDGKLPAPVLEVKDLSKEFILKSKNKTTRFKALDQLSFQLYQGEILGLLGPNGAGKTTTIQMLLGLLKPTNGSIVYFGKNFKQYRSESLQNVAFASTYIDFPWRLTVEENLDVYARLYGLDKATRRKRIDNFLSFFKVREQKNKMMVQLSAGQRTRVMLVKAFLAYPKIVLLDEPTASLDPDIALDVRDFVKLQKHKYEVAIIFTSHNMAEVSDVCDRVLFLQKGRLVICDTPENLVANLGKTKLKLNVGDGVKRTKKICVNRGLDINIDGRKVIVKIDEKDIASFLGELAKEGVDYKEINIIKPTLEDYFLMLSKRAKQ